MGATVPRHTFPSTQASMSAVRRFVELHTQGNPCSDDSVLVADELATNAVQHTAGVDFTVILLVSAGGVMVMVLAAPLSATVPHICSDGVRGRDNGERGRGMVIVEALASEWGVGMVNGMQAVHATLTTPAETPCVAI